MEKCFQQVRDRILDVCNFTSILLLLFVGFGKSAMCCWCSGIAYVNIMPPLLLSTAHSTTQTQFLFIFIFLFNLCDLKDDVFYFQFTTLHRTWTFIFVVVVACLLLSSCTHVWLNLSGGRNNFTNSGHKSFRKQRIFVVLLPARFPEF